LPTRTRNWAYEKAPSTSVSKKPEKMQLKKSSVRKLILQKKHKEEEESEETIRGKQVEARELVVKVTQEIKGKNTEESSKILATNMKIKYEYGTWEAARPEANIITDTQDSLAHSTLSNPVHLDSLEHTPSPTDNQPLSSVYTKLLKSKTPSLSPKPQTDPVLEVEEVLNVRPLQTYLLGEKPLIIPSITKPT
jgi:hypothetical protein